MAETESGKTPRDKRPRLISALHQDISFANTYRLEVLKTMLAITTALLAFSISFRPSLDPVACEEAMIAGWTGLALSLIAGIATMYCWELFYISYRDYDWKGKNDDGKKHRKKITCWRRLLFSVQIAGFFIGVSGIAFFAVLNVGNVKHLAAG